MRTISWLAAGAAAIAIATAAPARPGGTGSGHGSLKVGWSGGGGHYKAGRGRSHFGIGPIGIDRRHGRHRGGFGRRDFHPYGPYGPYGAGGIAGPVGEVDPYGNGFFNGGGGRIRLRGGRPYYDYDRAYPYEWASATRPPDPDRAEAARRTEAPARCTFENGVRVCRGW